MKKNEVRLWINYHCEVFPDWATWYKAPTPAARAIQFDSYAKAFLKTDLNDAKAATDAMVAGDCRKPFLAEDHLARIIEYAGKLAYQHRPRPQYTDGVRTFNCQYCEDRGLVLVATERTYKLDGRDIHVRSEAKACVCKFGQAYSGILVFDPQKEKCISA